MKDSSGPLAETGVPRRLVYLFVVVAVGILTCAYFYYEYQVSQVREDAEKQLITVAELKVHELTTWKNERLKDAAFYQQNRSLSDLIHRLFQQPDDLAVREELASWFSVTQSSHGYGIFITDKFGEPVLSLPPEQAPLEDDVREKIPNIFVSGEWGFQDFQRNETTGNVHFTLMFPVLSLSPEIGREAVLVWRLHPSDYINRLLRKWPIPSETAETFLVRAEGNELVVLTELRFREKSALNLRFPLNHPTLPQAKIVRGTQKVVEGIDYRGEPIMATGRPVPGTPWFLIGNIDLAEVDAPLKERFWWLCAVVGALLTSAGSGMGLIWHHQRARHARERVQSAQKLREQATVLRQTLERLNFHVENSPLGVIEWDREFRIIRWSEQATNIFGWGADEVMGKYPTEWPFIHPDDTEYIKKVMDDLVSGVTPRQQNQNRNLTRAGDVVYCEWHNSVRFDDEGLPVSIFSLIQNVSDRVLAEAQLARLNDELEERVKDRTAQLEAANTELESFSYSVSHDLRAPLRSVAGFAQALQEHAESSLDATSLGYLQRVRNAADRMGRLIDDILKLSRLTRAEMHPTGIDLSAMAESIFESFQSADPERTVAKIIHPNLHLTGDPALIEILFSNLIENAWKFTSKQANATIEVGTVDTENGTAFFVRDNGAGFDSRYAHKMFTPFQRLHAPTEFPGTGIGLAIVHRIIARHGGTVWAEGNVNKGSTFFVFL